MSERSREAAEAPRDVLALWERTRTLKTDLGGLDGRLSSLEEYNLPDRVADLTMTVDKLARKPDPQKIPVWNWSQMDSQKQAEHWKFLVSWVWNIFKERFPSAFRDMLGYSVSGAGPACWHRHEEVVESLTGLMNAWYYAFMDPESNPMRVTEWLGRWLPDAVRQGEKALAQCVKERSHQEPLENRENLAVPQDLIAHIHTLETGEILT
ncbi:MULTISPECIES: hypothetical protein [unclassified Streptomyces]|uniref:hypothetical protein n=1 Tax=unclassified Streptomyces TaxID=2593676 RepID=UPI00278C2090|nr:MULTISPECIES: hypothetical protein [unclassified Streptomyces]